MKVVLLLLFTIMHISCQSTDRLSFEVRYKLPVMDNKAENPGVAGAFSGMINHKLVIAGGANFPDAAPWLGGHKTWWKTAYVLDFVTNQWMTIEDVLPTPLGYGVSIQLQDGILCIGGCSKDSCSRAVFELKMHQGRLYMDSNYPLLPVPLANATGCMIHNKVYIAGGQTSMQQEAASFSFYVLDLDQAVREWKKLDAWPGPKRSYAVSVAHLDKFYLFSGRDYSPGETTSILTDGYVYDPAMAAWNVVKGEFPVMAGTGFSDRHTIYLIGGSTQILPGSDAHPGFSNTICAYEPIAGNTALIEQHTAIPVTTNLVVSKDKVYITSGEVKPGIRTPHILEATF